MNRYSALSVSPKRLTDFSSLGCPVLALPLEVLCIEETVAVLVLVFHPCFLEGDE